MITVLTIYFLLIMSSYSPALRGGSVLIENVSTGVVYVQNEAAKKNY